MQPMLTRLLDWVVPPKASHALSETKLIRSFTFLHLFGPLMAQSLGYFLIRVDPGPVSYLVEALICCFWLLPLVLRFSGNLVLSAFCSVQLLTATSLIFAFFYGGMSSPSVPWLLIALLLGFFYLAGHFRLLIGSLALQYATFVTVYAIRGDFAARVPLTALSEVNLLSVFSATVYMSWVAIYYAQVVADQSEVEQEAAAHRRTTERLREATAAAERANRAKSIFLAKMSHELRTPLNAVIGYSELMLEDAELAGAPARKLADLQNINSAGRHLLSLVTDVLDVSQIEADVVELQIVPFELDAFLGDMLSTATPLITGNGNRFEVIRPERAVTLHNDPLKLRQALLNLLSNAGKFTENGTVTLTVRQSANGRWTEFEVRDTGIGLTADEIAQLFETFHQANSSIAKSFGGTGIGLALSQRFCTLMGGSVTVESERGLGSSFLIRVPTVVSIDAAVPAAPEQRNAA